MPVAFCSGSGLGSAPLLAAASYAYDADGTLATSNDGTAGSGTTYSTDAQGNIAAQTSSWGTATTSNTYSVLSMISGQTVAGVTTRDLYDAFGNVNCITTSSWTSGTCPAPGDTHLVELYSYDYKNRLTADTKFNSSGAITDLVSYTYDALDRVVIKSEKHGAAWTSTWTIFEGDSTTVAREYVYNTQNPGGTPSNIKNYAYDSSGNLVTLSNTQGSTTNRYSTVTNPRSSVSLLLDLSGNPKQSYGYTPYGQANSTLTQNGSLPASLNPYRFQSKRLDSVFNTYDMGARRYSLTTSRWQQQDVYYDASRDLGLAGDATTANRYGFAAGNPVNYVEADGHYVQWDGKPPVFHWDFGRWPSWQQKEYIAFTGVLYICADSGKANTMKHLGQCARQVAGIPPNYFKVRKPYKDPYAIKVFKAACGVRFSYVFLTSYAKWRGMTKGAMRFIPYFDIPCGAYGIYTGIGSFVDLFRE